MTIDQLLGARPHQHGRDLADLGGHRTTTGRVVRGGRLFRTWGAAKRRPGVATVIDLRAATGRPDVAGAAYRRLRVAGSFERDAATIAETLAILTDPWAYPAALNGAEEYDRSGAVVAAILGVLGVADDEIAAEAGAGHDLDALRRRYGSFDGYAAALGVGSAAGYVRDALLI